MEITTEPIVFNYKTKNIKVLPDAIPNLVPKKKLAEWQDGDDDPYYRIQAIEYPVLANGYLYVESFFESFINKIKERPIPGSKSGHEMWAGKRGPTDFLLIGGNLEKKGKGKGIAYLKMYIPPIGESGDNTTFIKENKTDMINYSLVTYPKQESEENPDGTSTIKIVESLFGERNDAVDYGTGAMKQILNANSQRIRRASVTEVRGLINSGKVDQFSSWSFSAADGNKMLGENGDNWSEYASWHLAEDTSAEEETKARYKYPYGKNGKVYLSALRAISSRAGQQWWSELSDLASSLIEAMDEKNNNKKGANMDKTEMFDKLRTMKANAEITLMEIANEIGLQNQVVTEAHINALKTVDEMRDLLGGDNVIDITKELKKNFDSGQDVIRNAKLDSLFGDNKDGKNDLRFYMGKETTGTPVNELDNKIENIKETDPIAKRLMAERADYTSEYNQLGSVDRKENQNDGDKTTGRRVDAL